ncbi:MAG TPA: hypothetical protein VMS12_03260 [Thermoanaerobaculia bacterium]|nr:hypothetical protein [Thermoanaerobaculia bacterium]
MNYELAIMALEGLGKSPIRFQQSDGTLTIEGAPSAFKELARLCLLMGSAETAADEQIELRPGMHLSSESPTVVLRIE